MDNFSKVEITGEEEKDLLLGMVYSVNDLKDLVASLNRKLNKAPVKPDPWPVKICDRFFDELNRNSESMFWFMFLSTGMIVVLIVVIAITVYQFLEFSCGV